jgi:hypothetical protein
MRVLADTTAMVAAHRRAAATGPLFDALDELWICDIVDDQFDLIAEVTGQEMVRLP